MGYKHFMQHLPNVRCHEPATDSRHPPRCSPTTPRKRKRLRANNNGKSKQEQRHMSLHNGGLCPSRVLAPCVCIVAPTIDSVRGRQDRSSFCCLVDAPSGLAAGLGGEIGAVALRLTPGMRFTTGLVVADLRADGHHRPALLAALARRAVRALGARPHGRRRLPHTAPRGAPRRAARPRRRRRVTAPDGGWRSPCRRRVEQAGRGCVSSCVGGRSWRRRADATDEGAPAGWAEEIDEAGEQQAPAAKAEEPCSPVARRESQERWRRGGSWLPSCGGCGGMK
jgi:hypothetical protein